MEGSVFGGILECMTEWLTRDTNGIERRISLKRPLTSSSKVSCSKNNPRSPSGEIASCPHARREGGGRMLSGRCSVKTRNIQ